MPGIYIPEGIYVPGIKYPYPGINIPRIIFLWWRGIFIPGTLLRNNYSKYHQEFTFLKEYLFLVHIGILIPGQEYYSWVGIFIPNEYLFLASLAIIWLQLRRWIIDVKRYNFFIKFTIIFVLLWQFFPEFMVYFWNILNQTFIPFLDDSLTTFIKLLIAFVNNPRNIYSWGYNKLQEYKFLQE